MKLSLPANVSRLRKENSKTQEQLAEALGGLPLRPSQNGNAAQQRRSYP